MTTEEAAATRVAADTRHRGLLCAFRFGFEIRALRLPAFSLSLTHGSPQRPHPGSDDRGRSPRRPGAAPTGRTRAVLAAAALGIRAHPVPRRAWRGSAGESPACRGSTVRRVAWMRII